MAAASSEVGGSTDVECSFREEKPNSTYPPIASSHLDSRSLSSVYRFILHRQSHRKDTFRLLENILDKICVSQLKWNVLLSGSMSECAVFGVGDIDIMLVDCNVQVMFEELIADVQDNGLPLLAATCVDHPGFYRLSCANPSALPERYTEATADDCIYISSFKFVEGMCEHLKSDNVNVGDIHGPAIKRPKFSSVHMPTDNVFALYCPQWPGSVSQRFEKSKWPTAEDLKKLKEAGCHLVPTGKNNSQTKSLEWRLSFSAAEKIILQSMISSTQYRVYNVLKDLLIKFKTNGNTNVSEILCSYYVKTLLFYAMEEENDSFWKEEIFLDCIYTILTRLSKCLRSHRLPNFFVPENNMIEHLSIESCINVANFIDDKKHVYTQSTDIYDYVDTLESVTLALDVPEIKHRIGIKNNLLQFLDPVFYVDLPGNISVEEIEDELLLIIRQIPTTFSDHPHQASSFVQILYRTCGNVCHQASLAAQSHEKKQSWISKAKHHYQKGRSLVYADGFDDNGFSGTVHLMQFYYLNGDFEATLQEVDSIEKYLDFVSFDKVADLCRFSVCSAICKPIHLPLLEINDSELYQYLTESAISDTNVILVNSMAFCHYMRIQASRKQNRNGKELAEYVRHFEEFYEHFLEQKFPIHYDDRTQRSTISSCKKLRDIVKAMGVC